MKKEVVCIIQARMGSERLPGKVIKELCGIPMIEHIVKRLKTAGTIDKIIVATSTNTENDILAQKIQNTDAVLFRGNEEDVLRRYVDAVEAIGGDYIIRVTGDCPLVSAEVIDELAEKFVSSNVDYMRVDVPDTFARGFDAEIFTKEALMKANQLAHKEMYREHVTLYMYRHPEIFSVSKLVAKEEWKRPHYRLCVDTPEDFEVVSNIYNNLYEEGTCFTIDEIIRYLDAHPEVASINQDIVQKHV
jgi:spore coat polysaccharide biosynthesis protein SpsF